MKNIEERLYEKRNLYICINENQMEYGIFYVIKDEIDQKKYLITQNELKELKEEPTIYMSLFDLTNLVYGTDKDKNNYLTEREAIAMSYFLDNDLIRETFLSIVERMKQAQAESNVSKQKKKVLVQK